MKKKITIVTIVLAIMACLLLCACGSKSVGTSADNNSSEATGKATIKITIQNDLIEPKTNTSEEFQTDCKTLGDFVKGSDLFVSEDGTYGIVITAVAGAAQDDENGIYWMFKVNGEDSMVGASEVNINDGDEYTFYTAGF